MTYLIINNNSYKVTVKKNNIKGELLWQNTQKNN